MQGHWVWHDHGWQWQPGHWYQGYARPRPLVIVEIPGHWS
ncbi:hypothetical protein [Pseudoduganella violaceinigra]